MLNNLRSFLLRNKVINFSVSETPHDIKRSFESPMDGKTFFRYLGFPFLKLSLNFPVLDLIFVKRFPAVVYLKLSNEEFTSIFHIKYWLANAFGINYICFNSDLTMAVASDLPTLLTFVIDKNQYVNIDDFVKNNRTFYQRVGWHLIETDSKSLFYKVLPASYILPVSIDDTMFKKYKREIDENGIMCRYIDRVEFASEIAFRLNVDGIAKYIYGEKS